MKHTIKVYNKVCNLYTLADRLRRDIDSLIFGYTSVSDEYLLKELANIELVVSDIREGINEE